MKGEKSKKDQIGIISEGFERFRGKRGA